MMASNRVAAAKERKQDRTHASHGEQRAQAAAEARQKQRRAEEERIERANEELRKARRDRPDPLDTSYQIGILGGEDIEGQQESAFIPFSVIDRNYTESTPESNAAVARGVRGVVQPRTKSLLIGGDGAPKMRENTLQRLDPSHRRTEASFQIALRKLAQLARDDRNVKMQRRYMAFRLDLDGVPMKSIAAQLGVSLAHAYNYRDGGREYIRGFMDATSGKASNE